MVWGSRPRPWRRSTRPWSPNDSTSLPVRASMACSWLYNRDEDAAVGAILAFPVIQAAITAGAAAKAQCRVGAGAARVRPTCRRGRPFEGICPQRIAGSGIQGDDAAAPGDHVRDVVDDQRLNT